MAVTTLAICVSDSNANHENWASQARLANMNATAFAVTVHSSTTNETIARQMSADANHSISKLTNPNSEYVPRGSPLVNGLFRAADSNPSTVLVRQDHFRVFFYRQPSEIGRPSVDYGVFGEYFNQQLLQRASFLINLCFMHNVFPKRFTEQCPYFREEFTNFCLACCDSSNYGVFAQLPPGCFPSLFMISSLMLVNSFASIFARFREELRRRHTGCRSEGNV